MKFFDLFFSYFLENILLKKNSSTNAILLIFAFYLYFVGAYFKRLTLLLILYLFFANNVTILIEQANRYVFFFFNLNRLLPFFHCIIIGLLIPLFILLDYIPLYNKLLPPLALLIVAHLYKLQILLLFSPISYVIIFIWAYLFFDIFYSPIIVSCCVLFSLLICICIFIGNQFTLTSGEKIFLVICFLCGFLMQIFLLKKHWFFAFCSLKNN